MPALQVRDFPDGLYASLKALAAAEHRSVAQQTIALVEEGLRRRSPAGVSEEPARPDLLPSPLVLDTEEDRQARIGKRRRLFEEIRRLPWKVDVTTDGIVDMVREGREERTERILEACGLCEEPAAREVGRSA